MQWVIQFKLLKFDEGWSNCQPVLLPQGAAYAAKTDSARLWVVVELEPSVVQTLQFELKAPAIVGVSVPENLVFVPPVEKLPTVLAGVQVF